MSDSIQYGVSSAEQIAGKTGLEILRAIISGELPTPPFSQTFNCKLVEANEGYVVFEGQTDPKLLNPLGIVHGGWALTLIDSVTGCAAHSTLPVGSSYTTVETKSNFTRPIAENLGKVRAEGRVIAKGRKIITAEGKIFSEEGKLLAHGTATLMVL
jgi:uncharacterized protein (TIGR00369 family)